MKGTANKIFWILLEDCRTNFNKSTGDGCPGCRSSLIEDEHVTFEKIHPCETCIFWNIKSMRDNCTTKGRKILKEMEDV